MMYVILTSGRAAGASRRSYTSVDCVVCLAISKKAQTNFHAWAHRGLLNKEAGRLPPTDAPYSVEIMSVDLFAHYIALEKPKWRACGSHWAP